MLELIKMCEDPDESLLQDLLCLDPGCGITLANDEQLGRKPLIQTILCLPLAGHTRPNQQFEVVQ
jgi:hypothetical protein